MNHQDIFNLQLSVESNWGEKFVMVLVSEPCLNAYESGTQSGS